MHLGEVVDDSLNKTPHRSFLMAVNDYFVNVILARFFSHSLPLVPRHRLVSPAKVRYDFMQNDHCFVKLEV